MKLHAIITLAMLSLASAQSDSEVAARKAVVELAGAFSNDGFEMRDSNYVSTLSKEKPLVVQVNLYAGNAYWFSAASASPDSKIALALFDEKGNALKVGQFGDGPRAAINFSPNNSGPYYLRLTEATDQPSVFCLTYSYK